jgi:glycosyltransferase involved in cell wall biosynthesis
MSLGRQSVIYSPGFNAGVTRAIQVLTVHDLIHLRSGEESGVAKTLYYEWVLKRAIIKAKVVMTVSETSKKLIEQWLDDPSVSVVNVGNGCSQAFTLNGRRAQISKPSLLMIGDPRPHKNMEVVLRALTLSSRLHLLWVVSDAAKATELLRSNGVESQVSLLSNLSDDELASYYRAAAAVVMPSLEEGFGLPALESLKCGTPVIYWAGCHSVREICGPNGVAIAHAEDAKEWADSMLSVLDATRPLDTAHLEQYTWPSVSRRVEETLLAAVAMHQAGAQKVAE